MDTVIARDALTHLEKQLRKNSLILLLFALFTLGSFTLLIVLALGLLSLSAALLVGAILVLVGGYFLFNRYRRALCDTHLASRVIDEQLAAKERAISFSEIRDKVEQELPEQEKEPLREKGALLERQLEAILSEQNLHQLGRLKFSPLERRIGYLLPLVWILIAISFWFGYFNVPRFESNPSAVKLEALLERYDEIPEELREALEQLSEALRSEESGGDKEEIEQALNNAEEVLEELESQMAQGDKLGSSRSNSQNGKRSEVVKPFPTATPTPTVTPTQTASRSASTPPESTPPDQQSSQQDGGDESGSEDQKSGEKSEQGKEEGDQKTDVQNSESSKSQGSSQSKQSESGDGKQEGGEGNNDSKKEGTKEGSQGSDGKREGDQQGSKGQGQKESDADSQDGQGQKEGGQKDGSGDQQSQSQGGSQDKSGQQQSGSGDQGEKEEGQQGAMEAAAQALEGIRQQLEKEGSVSKESSQDSQSKDQKGENKGEGEGKEAKSDQQKKDTKEGKGEQGSSQSKESPGDKQESGSDHTSPESGQSKASGSSTSAGVQPDDKRESDESKNPIKPPPVSDQPPKDWSVEEGKFGEGKGKGLGENKAFQDVAIGKQDEQIDTSQLGQEGEVTMHSKTARAKTKLSDVQLAKPEVQHDQSKQEIPLEYKDLLR